MNETEWQRAIEDALAMMQVAMLETDHDTKAVRQPALAAITKATAELVIKKATHELTVHKDKGSYVVEAELYEAIGIKEGTDE